MDLQPTDRLTPEQAELVETHYAYAYRCAWQARRKTWQGLDPEDLLGWAIDGLIDAARRYDPTSPAKFSTYARYRILGTINDEALRWTQLRRTGGDRVEEVELEASLDRSSWAAATVEGGYGEVECALAAASLIDRHARTPTQREVLELVAAGLSLAEVGQVRGVSEAAACHVVGDVRRRAAGVPLRDHRRRRT